MENKTTLGGIGLILIVVIGVYFYSQHAPVASVPEQASSTPTGTAATSSTSTGGTATTHTGTTSHSAPTVVQVPTLRAIKVDESALVATSSHPTITGTANITSVGMIIYNSEGVGIVGAWSIAVGKDGRWSYTVPLGLSKGTYTIQMLGADGTELKRPLTVK